MRGSFPPEFPPLMNPTAADEKPRLLWANVLMFVLTMAGAVIVVPWYGFTHGYSIAAWVWFAVFLYANGLAITGGYHRLWSHRTYDAHWSLRLVYMLLGAMALQNSILVWASGHRSHHQFVDDSEENTEAATALGMQPVHFRTAQDLERALEPLFT